MEEMISKAGLLADAVEISPGQSAVELAEALARKGKPDEVTDARLLAAIVYHWIGTNISYDIASLDPTSRAPQDPDKVLKARSAVCEGYSCLAAFLLNHLRVESRIIHGLARMHSDAIGDGLNPDENGHAWNLVKWGGSWHIMDFTWGAGSAGSGKFVPSMSWDWFDVSPGIAIYSHIPEIPDDQLLDPPQELSAILSAAHLKPRFFDAVELEPLPLIAGRIEVGTSPLKWNVRQGFEVIATAEAGKGAKNPVRAQIFLNPAGETEAHFPGLREGIYDLSLFSGASGQSERQHCAQFVMEILPHSSVLAPPKTFGKFSETGLQMVGPLSGRLTAGEWQEFKIKGPPGVSLALQYEGETTLNHLTNHSGEYVTSLALREGLLKLYLIENKLLWKIAEFDVSNPAGAAK